MERFFCENQLTNDESTFLNDVYSYFKNEEFGALFGGFPFIDNCDETKIIRGLVVFSGGILAFYKDSNDEDDYRRYIWRQLMSDAQIVTKMNYQFDKYITYYHIGDLSVKSEYEKKLENDEIRRIISIFQKINGLTKKDKRTLNKPNSLGSLIVARSHIEANLDKEQFDVVYNDAYINSNVRIRGLAGCGKTILLSEKMAYLHYKDENKVIGYIFYTKSLKQSIDNFFNRFYLQVSNNNTIPSKENIKIMHGWGSHKYPGLYSTVCDILELPNISYDEVQNFDTLCGKLIKLINEENKTDLIKMFDYIFIDEAQDFTLNFFKLARMCLKPDGKLVYAYDELQALNDTYKKMPTKKDIFDLDNCKDIDLSRCYRNPKEILVTAHALGLGIYHFNDKGERVLINAILEKDVWKTIGYHHSPEKIRDGEMVTFSRDTVIRNPIGDEAVVCKGFKSYSQQSEFLVKEIKRLIEEEEVLPDDILIIDLDSRNLNINFCFFMEDYQNIYGNKELPFEVSIINKESGYNFRLPNKVSYTTIYRAKGNEANIVFVINSNISDSILSYNRNKLFTAMTRAKFKVYICGIGQEFIDTILSEIDVVRKNKYCLKFEYPTREELKKCQSKVYEDNKTIEKVDKALELFSDSKNSDDFLKTFFGKLNKEELEKIEIFFKDSLKKDSNEDD